MRRAGTIFAAALLVAAASSAAWAEEASVEVEVDRTALSLDEDLEAEITMSGSYDRYDGPDLDGFEVLGRSRSQQIQIINGRMTRRQVLSLSLRPKRAGELTLGVVTLFDEGREVARSRPVTVTVREPQLPPATSADEARDLADEAREDLFLHAETARNAYYVGEPFVAAWRLYFRPRVRVQSAEVVTRPSLEGLLGEELLEPDVRPRVRETTIRGRRFRWVPRSVRLLTGLEPGEATIDSMAVRVTAGSFVRTTRRTIRSQPFKVDILPLPEEGRPAVFREGNIGRLQMSVSLTDSDGREPTQVETGERLMLEVSISGSGALVSVKPPVLEGGEQFEVQPLSSTSEDRIEKDASGMHGRRTFQFILVPREPGEHPAPTVRFAYFDPERAGYRTLSWTGDPLTVRGQALPEGGASPLAGEDIGPTIDAHTLRQHGRSRLAGTPLFWALVGLPLLLWFLAEARFRLRRRREQNPLARRAKGAHGNARKRLRVARQVMSEGLVKDFYGQVSRVLTGYLEERANLPAVGMTHEEIRQAGVEAGYPKELMDEVVVELENCDFARFAPSGSAEEQMRESLGRVEALLKRLDRVQPRRRP
ncbi:MAG: BatD family protein [Myxococcota bacterium]